MQVFQVTLPNKAESFSGSSETLVWVKYSMILVCDVILAICPRKEVILHKRTLLRVLVQKLVHFVKGVERKT